MRVFFENVVTHVEDVPEQELRFLEIRDKESNMTFVLPMGYETAAGLAAQLDGRSFRVARDMPQDTPPRAPRAPRR